MPYTQEEGGRLNNFAVEPAVYSTKAGTPQEKRNFAILAALATVLVGGLIAVAIFASQGG